MPLFTPAPLVLFTPYPVMPTPSHTSLVTHHLLVPHHTSLITDYGSVHEVAKWAGAFKDVDDDKGK